MFPKLVRRDVLLLLCIKAIALIVIYFVFVSPAIRPEPDARAVVAHLTGP